MGTLDYPRIRARATCPCCNNAKPAGNIVCWSCYREHDFRNGGEARFVLTELEHNLSRKQVTTCAH